MCAGVHDRSVRRLLAWLFTLSAWEYRLLPTAALCDQGKAFAVHKCVAAAAARRSRKVPRRLSSPSRRHRVYWSVYRADHGCTGQQRLAIPRSSARASRVPTQQLIIVMIAITEEQIAQRGLTPILKKNHRFTTEPGGSVGIRSMGMRGPRPGHHPTPRPGCLGRPAARTAQRCSGA
jgi:hypothetical protein